MILGAHESAAGGLARVFERAAADGADAIQIFTRSSRQWAARPLAPDEVDTFHAAHAAAGAVPTAAHASYLINLAAPDPALWRRSVDTLLDECRRAEALGIAQVIVHPGAAMGAPAGEGVARVVVGLREICEGLGRRAKVRLLLENTAGQGSSVGCTLEELAAMLDGAGEARLGLCLDTQHLWAAGLDWTTPRGYDRVFTAVDDRIGLRRLEAFHLNDSKRPLGARVDRHERIGEGQIGLAPFARLLGDPRFERLPGYLETPPLPDGATSFAEGLRRLRSLR